MKTIKSLTAVFLTAIICVFSITPYFAAKKPATPSLTLKNASNGIKASWKKVKGATKYVLKVKKSSASKYRTTYSGSKTSFTDDNLNPGVKYDFKVKAVSGKKSGSYSKKASLTFLDQPTLNVEELPLQMKEGLLLTWKKIKGAKGYRIYRSLKYSNSYKKIATITKGSTNYFNDSSVYDEKNFTQIKSYKYYIKAYCDDTSSAKSNVKSSVYGYLDLDHLDSLPLYYLTIKKGQVYKDFYNLLNANSAVYVVTWKSSKKSVAKVSDIGVITGVSKGTAKITASASHPKNGKRINMNIEVTVK